MESVDAAQGLSDFRLLLPPEEVLPANLLQDVWAFPSGAIALDYSSETTPQRYVRQNYIELFEAPRGSDVSPLAEYKRDLQADPSPAKSIIEIAGIPALVVTSHAPDDDFGHSNPAFVRLVVDGVEVQVSGGEDLDLLTSIAERIVVAANAG